MTPCSDFDMALLSTVARKNVWGGATCLLCLCIQYHFLYRLSALYCHGPSKFGAGPGG